MGLASARNCAETVPGSTDEREFPVNRTTAILIGVIVLLVGTVAFLIGQRSDEEPAAIAPGETILASSNDDDDAAAKIVVAVHDLRRSPVRLAWAPRLSLWPAQVGSPDLASKQLANPRSLTTRK